MSSPARVHLGLRPARSAAPPHSFFSRTRNARASAALPPTGKFAVVCSLCTTAGDFSDSCTAAFKAWTCEAGVPLAANSMNQPVSSRPGTVSLARGMLSRPGSTFADVTASALMRPAFTRGSRGAMPSTDTTESPLTTAWIAWPLLLIGTLLNGAPAI